MKQLSAPKWSPMGPHSIWGYGVLVFESLYITPSCYTLFWNHKPGMGPGTARNGSG